MGAVRLHFDSMLVRYICFKIMVYPLIPKLRILKIRRNISTKFRGNFVASKFPRSFVNQIYETSSKLRGREISTKLRGNILSYFQNTKFRD